ncbi:Uncharacterised protein [Bordetella pertussis]|nr:Uncharacterised protein [Bordetella pertussis]
MPHGYQAPACRRCLSQPGQAPFSLRAYFGSL